MTFRLVGGSLNHVLRFHVEVRSGRVTFYQGLGSVEKVQPVVFVSLCGPPTASPRTGTTALWVSNVTH